MRKFKSVMFGVAGSVLAAGSAMAADPMPVVVAAVPAASVPAPARTVVIDVVAGVDLSTWGGLSSYIEGMMSVTSASGWGVRFEGEGWTQLLPFSGGNVGGTLTLYRAFGDLELGVWAGGGFNFPCCGAGYGVGLSANYEHDSGGLYVSSHNSLQILPYISVYSYTEAEYKLRDNVTLSAYFDYYGAFDGGIGIDVNVTDRVELWGNLYYGTPGYAFVDLGGEFKLTDRFAVWSEVGFGFAAPFIVDLDLGTTLELTDELSIKTALDFDFDPFEFNDIEVWAELDHPFGTGPLSLTAEAGFGYDGDLYAWGNVGIRYKLGVPDDHDDNRLFGDVP